MPGILVSESAYVAPQTYSSSKGAFYIRNQTIVVAAKCRKQAGRWSRPVTVGWSVSRIWNIHHSEM